MFVFSNTVFFENETNHGHQVVTEENCRLEAACTSENRTRIVFMIDYHMAECVSRNVFDAHYGLTNKSG